MSLAKAFAACTFAPSTKGKNGVPALITPSPSTGTFKTTSFFIDSSGHSSFLLPLEIKFATQKDLETFLSSNSLLLPPANLVDKTKEVEDESEEQENEEKEQSKAEPQESTSSKNSFVGFEAKSNSLDEAKAIVVEAISIHETSVKDLVVTFNTEVSVRAANHDRDGPLRDASLDTESLDILTSLEITPVLTVKKANNPQGGSMIDVPDLMALERGAIPDHMRKESNARVQKTTLPPVILDVTLTHAFTISVKSLPGTTLGKTMISLSVRHSNSHREPVTISNIAIHPGHSRYETVSQSSRRMTGGQYSVTNMTKAVQWGYAPQMELRLPLTLNPYDAYSTVLDINAGEEVHSRLFVSPVSVTGVVGRPSSDMSSSSVSPRRVVVAADAHWATELVAVEPADAFRIDMKLKNSEVTLGEPMSVSLRIFNLSLEPRNLMLLMAKGDNKGASTKDEAINSAVVSEVDGYTFGVWGISGEDDGTGRLNRDRELLAVDGALMLGEVLGQHAVDAELRFVPLREGRLHVPNWKLYDKSCGKWYTCVHNLSMVAHLQR